MRRIALFVVIACLMSSCALVGLSPGCSGTVIIGEFRQVGDLVKNANVQASDVEIGTVDDIKLQDWHAEVTMCIDPGEKVSSNVKAVVRTTSLLGEKFVDLEAKSLGPPFLSNGDVLGLDQTGKAAELQDVFARLAAILGAGNLEQINRFTHSQALILRNHVSDLRTILGRLNTFTTTLSQRRAEIASSVDHLDNVATSILNDSPVLQNFLKSFAGSSTVLANQKQGINNLLFALERFSRVSVALLNATENGLNSQFKKLRPVLRTVVANSANLRATLQSLAVFSQRFPATMPGDYLQLDVCQAVPNNYDQGTTCPQNIHTDDPHANPGSSVPSNSTELILRQPLRGRS